MRIYAAKQAYPTSTDVTFQAVTDVPDPVEFLWHFGDSTSARTTSRTVTTRYHKPGRYGKQLTYSEDAPLTPVMFDFSVLQITKRLFQVNSVKRTPLHQESMITICKLCIDITI